MPIRLEAHRALNDAEASDEERVISNRNHIATAPFNSSIVEMFTPSHHCGILALTIAAAIGGQTAFPHRATCCVL